MGGLAAIDLRRDDRVGEIEVIVAGELVEVRHVLGVTGASFGENLRLRGEAAEEVRHVVGRPAHEAEGHFRPTLCGDALGAQVGMATGDLVAAPNWRAAVGRRKGHDVAIFRRGGIVEKPGDRLGAAAKGRVARRVGHARTVDIDRPSAALQAVEEGRARPQWRRTGRVGTLTG